MEIPLLGGVPQAGWVLRQMEKCFWATSYAEPTPAFSRPSEEGILKYFLKVFAFH